VIGFAVAVPMTRLVSMEAPRGQLPGFASVHDFSPHGYGLRYALLLLCTLTGAVVGSRIAGPLRHRSRRTGDETSSVAAGASKRRSGGVLASTTTIVVAHAILLWVFIGGVGPESWPPVATLAGCLALSAALATAMGRGDPGRGAPTLGSAAFVLPAAFWQPHPAAVDVACAAFALIAPIVLFALRLRRPPTRLATLVLVPLSIAALAASTSMRGPAIADLFEDGHGTLPASEYRRGELPYRDIIPGHGLATDGVLQLVGMRLFGDDYRGLRAGERLTGAIFWPSVYLAAYGATGNPAVAFASTALTFLCFPAYSYARSLPAFWIFGLATLASRTARRRYWFAAGALIPIALCWAVDFAAYGAAIAAVAVWISRGRRALGARSLLLGVGAAALAILLGLGSMGILGAFLSTTFTLLPTLPPVYALPLERPTVPAAMTLPAVFAYVRDRTMFLYCVAAAGSVIVAAAVARAPVVGARARQALPAFAFVIAAMFSVIERRHINYPYFLVPMALLLGGRWLAGLRTGMTLRKAGAVLLAAVVLLAWRPTSALSAAGLSLRGAARPAELRELPSPPRARGALFTAADARLVRATEEFLKVAGLTPNDTWLDFANVPGLYYLFDRDCPIRFYEVPYYESDGAQKEVIAAIERNPRVRAVLIRDGLSSQPMDGVENGDRAPLVARYISERFAPFVHSEGVEFWLRR